MFHQLNMVISSSKLIVIMCSRGCPVAPERPEVVISMKQDFSRNSIGTTEYSFYLVPQLRCGRGDRATPATQRIKIRRIALIDGILFYLFLILCYTVNLAMFS